MVNSTNSIEQTEIPSSGKAANQGDQLRNRSHLHTTQWAVGDAVKVLFFLDKTPRDVTQLRVTVAGVLQRPSDRGTAHDFTLLKNAVTFTVPPGVVDVAFEVTS